MIRDREMLSGSGPRRPVQAGGMAAGWPTLTRRGGVIVYRDGEVPGAPGSGERVRCDPWRDPPR